MLLIGRRRASCGGLPLLLPGMGERLVEADVGRLPLCRGLGLLFVSLGHLHYKYYFVNI